MAETVDRLKRMSKVKKMAQDLLNITDKELEVVPVDLDKMRVSVGMLEILEKEQTGLIDEEVVDPSELEEEGTALQKLRENIDQLKMKIDQLKIKDSEDDRFNAASTGTDFDSVDAMSTSVGDLDWYPLSDSDDSTDTIKVSVRNVSSTSPPPEGSTVLNRNDTSQLADINKEVVPLPSHQCIYCDRSFTNLINFNIHMSVHRRGKFRSDATVLDQGSRKEEEEEKQEKDVPDKTVLSCGPCDRSFENLKELKEHVLSHDRLYPKVCIGQLNLLSSRNVACTLGTNRQDQTSANWTKERASCSRTDNSYSLRKPEESKTIETEVPNPVLRETMSSSSEKSKRRAVFSYASDHEASDIELPSTSQRNFITSKDTMSTITSGTSSKCLRSDKGLSSTSARTNVSSVSKSGNKKDIGSISLYEKNWAKGASNDSEMKTQKPDVVSNEVSHKNVAKRKKENRNVNHSSDSNFSCQSNSDCESEKSGRSGHKAPTYSMPKRMRNPENFPRHFKSKLNRVCRQKFPLPSIDGAVNEVSSGNELVDDAVDTEPEESWRSKNTAVHNKFLTEKPRQSNFANLGTSREQVKRLKAAESEDESDSEIERDFPAVRFGKDRFKQQTRDEIISKAVRDSRAHMPVAVSDNDNYSNTEAVNSQRFQTNLFSTQRNRQDERNSDSKESNRENYRPQGSFPSSGEVFAERHQQPRRVSPVQLSDIDVNEKTCRRSSVSSTERIHRRTEIKKECSPVHRSERQRNQQMYLCPLCPNAYTDAWMFSKHFEEHKFQNTYNVEQKLKQERDYEDVEIAEKKQSVTKMFECYICSKVFMYQTTLEKHMNIHNQFQSPNCDEYKRKRRDFHLNDEEDVSFTHRSAPVPTLYRSGPDSTRQRFEPDSTRHCFERDSTKYHSGHDSSGHRSGHESSMHRSEHYSTGPRLEHDSPVRHSELESTMHRSSFDPSLDRTGSLGYNIHCSAASNEHHSSAPSSSQGLFLRWVDAFPPSITLRDELGTVFQYVPQNNPVFRASRVSPKEERMTREQLGHEIGNKNKKSFGNSVVYNKEKGKINLFNLHSFRSCVLQGKEEIRKIAESYKKDVSRDVETGKTNAKSIGSNDLESTAKKATNSFTVAKEPCDTTVYNTPNPGQVTKSVCSPKGKSRRCPYCLKLFYRLRTWRAHVKSAHPRKSQNSIQTKSFSCKFCSRTFSDRSQQYLHTLTHRYTNNNNNNRLGATRKSAINVKDTTDNSLKTVKCQHCSKCFRNVYQLNSHRCQHKGRIRKSDPSPPPDEECKFCSSVFHSRQDLSRHYRETHKISGQDWQAINITPSKDLTTSTSPRDTSTEKTVPRVDSSVQGSGGQQSRKTQCEKCFKFFLNRHGLSIHMSKHKK